MLITVKNALDLSDTVLREIAQWLDLYVSKPDPRTSRSEAMCVRSRAAIDRGLILLERRVEPPQSLNAYLEEIRQLDLRYCINRNDTAQLADYFSVLFCYGSVHLALFDEACRIKKSSFLKREILIGKFHPEINLHSLDDAKHRFKPTPFPILAIRKLIRADYRFLASSRHVSDRAGLIEIYQNKFGD